MQDFFSSREVQLDAGCDVAPALKKSLSGGGGGGGPILFSWGRGISSYMIDLCNKQLSEQN